jgi:hypothetical protein
MMQVAHGVPNVLAATLSDYLVQRVEGIANITVHPYTEITTLDGDPFLQRVSWTIRTTGKSESRPIAYFRCGRCAIRVSQTRRWCQ